MVMNASELQSKLADALPGADIRIDNLRNDGYDHMMIQVVAAQFTGLPRLDQHRMIYRVLKGSFNFEKALLSLRTEAK
jgi:stress-induced morphogen